MSVKVDVSFGYWVLVAQQPIGGLILLNGREAAQLLIESVIRVIVVALTYLTQQNRARARLHLKIVV